jgi:hypothetical protein
MAMNSWKVGTTKDVLTKEAFALLNGEINFLKKYIRFVKNYKTLQKTLKMKMIDYEYFISLNDKDTSSAFELVYDLYTNRYDESKETLFNALVENIDNPVLIETYETYDKMNKCLQKVTPNVERHFVFSFEEGNTFITMLVNVFPIIGEVSSGAEHIYITKSPSDIICEDFLGYASGVSEFDLHLFALNKFNPQFIVTDKEDDALNKMDQHGMIQETNNHPPTLPNLKCEYPVAIFNNLQETSTEKYEDINDDAILMKHRKYIYEYYLKYEANNFKLTICDAVFLYQKFFDNYINSILREDSRFTITNPKLLRFFKTIINVIDKYFLSKDVPKITKRMVDNQKNVIYRGEKELCAGGVCRFGLIPSYTSATTLDHVAVNFTNKTDCCLYEYFLEEGTPYIDVDRLMENTKKKCKVELIAPYKEREYLLPRGIILSAKTQTSVHNEIQKFTKQISYDKSYIVNNPVLLPNDTPPQKKTRCQNGSRKNKNGDCSPTSPKTPPPPPQKKTRCQNGSRKNKNGDCIPTKHTSPSPDTLPHPPQKKTRCPNGSRKNKNGDCIPTKHTLKNYN